MNEMISK